jgi:hypothetical protein
MYRDAAALCEALEKVTRERAALTEERDDLRKMCAPSRSALAMALMLTIVSVITAVVAGLAWASARRAEHRALADEAFARDELWRAEQRFEEQLAGARDFYARRADKRIAEYEARATACEELARSCARRTPPQANEDGAFDSLHRRTHGALACLTSH